MSACSACGYENAAGEDFCGSCGVFLDWKPDAPPAPAPEPAGEAEGPGPAVVDAPAAQAKPPPAPRVDDLDVTPIEDEATAEQTPAPAAAQPEAVKPGASQRRTAPPTTAAPQQRGGDLVCGVCGVGNASDRRFCGHCGASLLTVAPDPVPVRLPWWKRLFSRRPKPEPVLAAGERPMVKGGSGPGGKTAGRRAASGGKRVARWAAIAVPVLAILVLASVTGGAGDAYRSVKKLVVPSFAPVRPVKAEATSALPGHGAEAAIDGLSNQAWTEGATGDGEGQELTLTFSGPVDIDKVGITSGASVEVEEYLAQPRPRLIHLSFSDGTEKDVVLDDKPGFQSFSVKARNVDSVKVKILAVYPAGSGGHDGSIAEIELFTKR